jgi:hypothetical protein
LAVSKGKHHALVKAPTDAEGISKADEARQYDDSQQEKAAAHDGEQSERRNEKDWRFL